jgi:hypothetical protein
MHILDVKGRKNQIKKFLKKKLNQNITILHYVAFWLINSPTIRRSYIHLKILTVSLEFRFFRKKFSPLKENDCLEVRACQIFVCFVRRIC